MRIREFKVEDYSETMGLWKESGLIIRPGDDLQGIKLKLERDPDLFLVAEENNEIVGVVMGAWDGRRGWINHLAVKKNWQRQGVGRTLIRELEERLVAKGARKVNAQVYRSNRRSLDFFNALGYGVHSGLLMIGKHLKK